MEKRIIQLIKQKGIHGIEHANRVMCLSLYLANKLLKDYPDIDMHTILISSLLHDCGRSNDRNDKFHAYKSVEIITKWVYDNNLNHNVDLISKCVIHHNSVYKENYEIPIEAKIIADADKLDRERFRSGCNPKYLELEESKKIIWLAKLLNNK